MKYSKTLLFFLVSFLNVVSMFAQQSFSTEVIKEKDDKLKYEMNVSYSLLKNYKDAETEMSFNQSVKDLVLGDVNQFRESMKDWTPIENMYSIYELSDSVLFMNDRIVSVKYYGFMYYSGAAHPMTFFMSLNYDLQNKKLISLVDLFVDNYLDVISSYCIADLKKSIQEYSESDWITTGAGPKAENFMIFNILRTHLLITFPVYQVAPYVAGPQEVEIPYDILIGAISASSPLKGVIN